MKVDQRTVEFASSFQPFSLYYSLNYFVINFYEKSQNSFPRVFPLSVPFYEYRTECFFTYFGLFFAVFFLLLSSPLAYLRKR